MRTIPSVLHVLFATLPGLAAVLVSPLESQILEVPDLTLAMVGPNQAGVGPNPAAQATNYGGVGNITIASTFGSGVLISPTVMLTAAHVVEGFAGSGVANFNTTGGFAARNISSVTLHPLWNSVPGGNLNYDLAWVTLDAPIATTTPYELYTGSDEIGQNTEMVGYGLTNTSGIGIKRLGVNEIEFTYDFVPPTSLSPILSGHILVSDFDSDGSDFMVWSGDSGGPLFIDGKVAGIASWISDSTPTYNDFFGHVRVSRFTSAGGFLFSFVPAAAYVPEPGTMAYGLLATVAFRWNRRRQRASGHGDGTSRRDRVRFRSRARLKY